MSCEVFEEKELEEADNLNLLLFDKNMEMRAEEEEEEQMNMKASL